MKAGRILLLLILWCLPVFAAAPVTVQNLRMWRAPDNTRLVFDLSDSIEHRVFALEGPHRLVIDLDNARFQGSLPEIDPANPILSAFRSGRPEGNTLRFVLDLKRAVKTRSFVLKPAGQYGHRLVVDLIDPQAEAEETRAAPEEPAAVPAPSAPTIFSAPPRQREWVIAIDAGHGGEDPGARGRQYRTREKDVTLAIARELARLVAQEPSLKPVLIRDGDYYIGLRKRFLRAKHERADVFVSIHADAMPGRRIAYGSSVYALSEKGATSAFASALADRENYADLVGGVSLNDKTDDVRRTLLDLSTDKQIEHSLQLGDDVLAELARIGRVHLSRPAQASFAVLKSPDIPSILVETAFISSPIEEKQLRDSTYQQRIAAAILKGVKRYLAREGRGAPMPQQVVSDMPREHVVQVGETLGSIARQYNINLEVLRFLNNLTESEVPIGFRLRLPDEARGGVQANVDVLLRVA